MKKRVVLHLAALSAVLFAAGGLGACGKKEENAAASGGFKSGTDITGASYAQDFSLPDFDGNMRTLADFSGKVTVVFFGFVQCPDVCPTTMVELMEVKQKLGDDGERMQVIFITVDPERDTPEILKAYATAFSPDFLALLPQPRDLPALAKEFKVFYKKNPTSEGQYTMDHTAGCYVFDTKGKIRLVTRYGAPAQDMADDIAVLLKEAG